VLRVFFFHEVRRLVRNGGSCSLPTARHPVLSNPRTGLPIKLDPATTRHVFVFSKKARFAKQSPRRSSTTQGASKRQRGDTQVDRESLESKRTLPFCTSWPRVKHRFCLQAAPGLLAANRVPYGCFLGPAGCSWVLVGRLPRKDGGTPPNNRTCHRVKQECMSSQPTGRHIPLSNWHQRACLLAWQEDVSSFKKRTPS